MYPVLTFTFVTVLMGKRLFTPTVLQVIYFFASSTKKIKKLGEVGCRGWPRGGSWATRPARPTPAVAGIKDSALTQFTDCVQSWNLTPAFLTILSLEHQEGQAFLLSGSTSRFRQKLRLGSDNTRRYSPPLKINSGGECVTTNHTSTYRFSLLCLLPSILPALLQEMMQGFVNSLNFTIMSNIRPC